MEFIFEFILELVLDGSIEVSKNNKIPKFIRYPLIIILILFFITVIGLILFTGVLMLEKNILAGVLMILLGLLMFTISIIKFRKAYFIKKRKN